MGKKKIDDSVLDLAETPSSQKERRQKIIVGESRAKTANPKS